MVGSANAEELVERSLAAGLFRFRMWQLDRHEEIAATSDEDLMGEGSLPHIKLSVIEAPDLPEPLLVRGAWRYMFEKVQEPDAPDEEAVLWAQVTEPVVRIAARSLATEDPDALVGYWLTFWAHLSCHNAASLVGPDDAGLMTRHESDGIADHVARVVGLQCYGYPACDQPIDKNDPRVTTVMSGAAVPLFRVRAEVLGRAEEESEGREARRAWRELGARLIYEGLPADGVWVMPTDGAVRMGIGTLLHDYDNITLTDAAAHGMRVYRQHLDACGDMERDRLHSRLKMSRRRP
jgi:hypothetical protein